MMPAGLAVRTDSMDKAEMCQKLVIKSLELAQMREAQVRCSLCHLATTSVRPS
jgi:hypothetical protein